MRFFISGPRLFGGLIRPGISFGGPRYGRSPSTPRAAVDYIYVIEGTHGLVKIGKSNDPDVRKATLQTGSAHLLRIASVTPVPIIWVEAVEHKAHDMLEAQRGNGEWFCVSPNVAVAAIYAAAERLGVDLTSQLPAEEVPRKHRLTSAAITAAIIFVVLVGMAVTPVIINRIIAAVGVGALAVRWLVVGRPAAL